MAKIKGLTLVLPLILLCTIHVHVIAQEVKKIELEDIFLNGYFSPQEVGEVNWTQDGKYYTQKITDFTDKVDVIKKYDITSGKEISTLFDQKKIKKGNQSLPSVIDSYRLSPDESLILIGTGKEEIYRRSYKSDYYVYDIKNQALSKINQSGKISYATFSPDGQKIAYVRNNDLFYVSFPELKEIRVTNTGKFNHIINGSTDWVYEEEFAFVKAFFWSPDSKKLAYYTFDESEVKEYNMQLWYELYPEDYKFKYPKAGEKNSTVKLTAFHLADNRKIALNIGEEKNIYIPRVKWTHNPDILSVYHLNRLQNDLKLLHINTNTGASEVIIHEKSDTYVDIEFTDEIFYLQNAEGFVKTSERSGFKHIYHHDMEGNLITQITEGPWVVDEFYGIDEEQNILYFTSTEDSPPQRHLYSVHLDGSKKRKLTSEAGYYEAEFSHNFKFYIQKYSSAKNPPVSTLHEAPSGKQLKVLEDNQRLQDRMDRHAFGNREFFSFQTKNEVALNGYIIKPADFDSNKKYPVLMYVYGGPGSQLVLDKWGGSRDLFHHYLTAKGFLVACIDNRGTGGRGKAFKHATYKKLGKLETEDQIEGAKYLGSLPYVDKNRIGIWGWSYGGYMSSLVIFQGSDILKAAVSIAPVTHWRFYDTIYTERFMQTPQLNPAGYDENSPINFAYLLQDPFLLVHGTGDDNVHFQNTIELQNALIAANKQFDTFLYPNRDHSMGDALSNYHLFTKITRFIDENL